MRLKTMVGGDNLKGRKVGVGESTIEAADSHFKGSVAHGTEPTRVAKVEAE